MIGPGNGAGKVEAMKLSENNARFAVVYNAFHGGGVTSYHASLSAAEAAQRRARVGGCCCGCCAVVPITPDAAAEMHRAWEAAGYIDDLPFLADIPQYTGAEFSPYVLCR